MTEGIILDEASDFMQSMDDAPHVPLHKALRAVLATVEIDRARPVTPAWASRLVQQYVGVEFKDLKFLNNYLLDMLAEIRDCTENLCSLHSELLQDSLSAADDLEDHRDFYVLLIGEWQKILYIHQRGWDSDDDHAGARLAAHQEAAHIVFSGQGFIGYFSAIGFQMTEAENDDLRAGMVELETALQQEEK